MFREILKMAVSNLFRRKTRTVLTVLGVVIGVSAIVGMLGVAEGMNEAILGQIGKFQSNLIEVFPGSFGMQAFSFGVGAEKAAELTEDDVDIIEKISGVKLATGEIMHSARIEYEDESISGMMRRHATASPGPRETR